MYYFDPHTFEDLQVGDPVIVETSRGIELGTIAMAPRDVPKSEIKGKLKRIIRKATPVDLLQAENFRFEEPAALQTCQELVQKLSLPIKVLEAEYSFDGSWLTFHYATENKKLNLGRLQKDLNRRFHTKVELRLIGPRDVAKILGGYGACGAPRCCSTFLTEFSPVSIRMAKAQGISLSPQEITGMCGRLRCCLVYEYEQYVEAKKTLPKMGKRVGSPYGNGIVKDVRVLRESVLIETEEGERHEVFRHEIEPLEELEALQKKADAGCSKHENGGCDCGAKR